MKTELTSQEAFQDKMKERLRQDIGDLLPDEMLAQMVKTAIHNLFNAKPDGNYKNCKTWLQIEVESLMRPMVEELLRDYFTNNNEELKSAIKGAINNGLSDLLAKTIIGAFTSAGNTVGYNLGDAFADGMRQSFQARGLV